MLLLIAGLVVFLGAHSVRIVADGWRTRTIARVGTGAWKGAFTVVSIVGLVLMVIGWGQTRADPVLVWTPPLWTYHLAIALTLPAFLLLVAAYVPRNHLRAWVGHPMLAGVKLWALAHLLANGRLGDMLLFGALLVWAIACFIVSRRRDRAAGVVRAPGTLAGDAAVLVLGVALWFVFARWLHLAWIGVDPLAWMR